jgi:hypothetical protein
LFDEERALFPAVHHLAQGVKLRTSSEWDWASPTVDVNNNGEFLYPDAEQS